MLRSCSRRSVQVNALNRRDILGISLSGALVLYSGEAKAASLSDLPKEWAWAATAPQPILFPRKPLDQRFAVLLMRASYEAVDDLDFMPMDQFQKSFWLFRQGEQESYNLQYSPLKPRTGDLTDPLYFDFIAFSQYAVIGKEIPKGAQVFKEFCEECPDQSRVVRRDPANADNALLPKLFSKAVGDKIYEGLLNGFRDEVFGAPAPLPKMSSMQQVVSGVKELSDVLVKSGFALKSEVVPLDESSFRMSLQGPANLWSVSALNYRRSPVVNHYDIFAVEAFLRASGKEVECETSYTDIGVEHVWKIMA